MPNEVLETETFSRLFETLSPDEKEWIRKMILQLKETAEVGKPLQFNWFREKKFGGKRLYYLVYSGRQTVLLVAFGDKKDQQKIINQVLVNREAYRKAVEET
ncbi:MAG: hypothetical protein HY917_05750 [Candidatus Diapherotrites archaeon]|nr:hypothetical protein [Candidatus Diapherotrites archaeon]